jgi:predicted SAM-dependent methyltransferase
MHLEDSDFMFDVIMMHHSFEHMQDPEAVLQTCYDHLNPGGKLLVRCPVADAEIWKTKRELWVQLDAPRHLIIPTVAGMKNVANRVGFNLQEIEFDSSDFQFWGTLLYEHGERLDHSKINAYLNADERNKLKQKAVQYNKAGKGDQACFYLTKPR